ncbi:MAG: NAD(P)-binding domain-containing protein, partial [Firmicutes bacterium]|nr:NAD(P)-binding domain-containing protein [Bacillota bacterium]
MRIVVVGLGRVGYNISKALSEEGHDVIIIDKDQEVLRAAAATLDVMTVAGNGASARILEAVDIKNVDILLAVTEHDELNMIACMTAKQSGVPMTVARIRNPDYTSFHPY